ncbi:metallophosphoesterase [Carnobacterium sp. ISL-102]|uniref:metallophosphoesterase n=1 Tax=Carnobacterium sp. ISL-102 TaxID=2819142 RepID=UPI001BECADB3|nr:metallophosphoesterase [Carnobacterium sp. ISL-102]MBT2731426.1 metallophosphoesterase [Carnobacterium sp. ISL-102]
MKKIILVFLLFIGLAIPFCLYGYQQNRSLDIEHQTILLDDLPQELDQLKIVHLSDTHFERNRISIETLLSAIKQAQPDFIFLTGDLIDRTADLSKIPLEEFGRSLVAIAPTYAVSGNHETSSGQLTEWEHNINDSGIVLLNNEQLTLAVNGTQLALAGVSDESYPDEVPIVDAASNDTPVLLLAHHPEYFEQYITSNPLIQPDIIFSGHAHGGQIRLPLIGPLYAPGQGLFPKYTTGIYTSESDPSKKLVVSRGIGNSVFPFRINNKPHLLIITLERTN